MKKQTKAERIFWETYRDCKFMVDVRGHDLNPDGSPIGYEDVSTDEHICSRTLNEMERILDNNRQATERNFKRGIIDKDEHFDTMFILTMVKVTIEHARKRLI